MFKVGQNVVYPTHGVGSIDKIEEREVLGKRKIYYLIKLTNSDMTVMLPVDQCEKARLRSIAEEEAINEVYSTFETPSENHKLDWKSRYNNNNEKLKDGSIISLSEVVRDLYFRNLIKELSKGEKRLYDNAFQLLSEEMSCIQQQDRSQVKSSILKYLKNEVKVPA